MATLQFIKEPNAKMDLTMLVSSSSYPKIIYGMPLDVKDLQIIFEFEFIFKFELKQKRKQKKNGKEKGPDPHGLASARRAHLLLSGPRRQSPLGQCSANKKRRMGHAH